MNGTLGRTAANTDGPPADARLSGLDLARGVALVGMIVVNFDVVMVPPDAAANALAQLFQGRAAATFVVLAGIGFGLGSVTAAADSFARKTLARALFLLVLGLLNMLVFPADIIHYYAFYFAAGLLFIRLPMWALALSIIVINAVFMALLLVLDYDLGWNWHSYDYAGLWTWRGFVRNLLFNGWHPVFPWLSFFVLGMGLARLNLSSARTQWTLLLAGLAIGVSVSLLSGVLMSAAGSVDPELAVLFGTVPIPPVPLYMIAGGGAAATVSGACLILVRHWPSQLAPFCVPGRQALSHYIGHIVVGIGTLAFLGLTGSASGSEALAAAAIYCALMWAAALLWRRRFRRGPLEALMRRCCG